MRGKRAWVLMLGVVCGMAILICFLRGTRKPDVTLTFIGFTNEYARVGLSLEGATLVIPMAVLKAENLGRVPVEISIMWRSHKVPTATNAWESKIAYAATNYPFPRIIQPGKAWDLHVYPPPEGKEFCWTELKYLPQTKWRRFYNWALAKSGPAQSFLAWALPAPKGKSVQSGLIGKPSQPMNSLPGSGSAFAESIFEEMHALDQKVKDRLLELEKH